MLKAGIVGLPNVGKSTLFNALTRSRKAEAANYPFCTIDPNVGGVTVPDDRLAVLQKIAKTNVVIPAAVEFVDIAGLVKGASKGEGLGNQFLGTIREVDAIAHVLRCFEDGDVTHVSGSVDPVRDAEIVETELMLADLDSLEKRLPNLEKRAKGGDKEAAAEAPVVKKALDALREGKPAREAAITAEERPVFRLLQLITAKPMMYVLNVDEAAAATGNAHSAKAAAYAKMRGMPAVVISAAIEAEVAQLPPEDQDEYLASLGLKETGLARVVRACYQLVDLVTFFTVGAKEERAWTVGREPPALEPAGVTHTDLEKGFIRAETIAYDDYVTLNGESGARDAGKLQLEGKDHAVQGGDGFHCRFNV